MLKAQLAKVKATIADKQKAMKALHQAAHEKGLTLNAEQNTQYEALEKEVEQLEKEAGRIEKLIADVEKATPTLTPVAGENGAQAKATAEGDPNPDKPNPKIEIVKLEKGIGFAQYARAKLASALAAKNGNFVAPVEMAKQMGFDDEVQDLVQKATVGSTVDSAFAAALVQENRLVGEFVDLLKAATVFDKLTGMRNVPFNSTIPAKTKRGQASWVGQGQKKPLTNPEFGDVKIKEHKLAAITVYTQELMRRSDPAVDVLVRDDLIEASQILIDETFLGVQVETDVIPAGVLSGVTAITASGTTAAAYDADLQELEDKFLEANLSLDGSYYLMSETRASRMGRIRDALGNYYFQGMQGVNKELNGRPVITSQTVGDKIALIKTSELLLAQDGGVDVSYSDQATLENADGTIINLWQENKFAVRVEKYITWAKRRPIAAAWIDYSTP